MAQIDFKMTVWESIYIPNELVEQITEGIKHGNITNVSDLYKLEDSFLFDSEILLETREQISKEENDGQPTIELIVKGKTVITN